jgi:hypothetical protein
MDHGIKEWKPIAEKIAETFIREIDDIEGDIVKTKSL